MKRVFKYPLVVTDHQFIEVPIDSKMLKVGLQGGSPVLWALVDDEAPTINCRITTRGTGHPVPDAVGPYIDTYQLDNGLVFHVFKDPTC